MNIATEENSFYIPSNLGTIPWRNYSRDEEHEDGTCEWNSETYSYEYRIETKQEELSHVYQGIR